MANGDLGLLSFSAIQDAPELLRANQDVSRSKGHLVPMAEPSLGQCCLAAVDLCQSHCKGVYVSRCFSRSGKWKTNPPDNSARFGNQAL